MVYKGGGQQKTYYAFVDLNHPARTCCRMARNISSKFLNNNRFRITLYGANNASGNTKLLVQLYPPHGAPQDTSTCDIANPIVN
jgi:hypothetical protein